MFGANKELVEIVDVDEVEATPKGKGKKVTKAKELTLEEKFADLCGSYGSVDGVVSIKLIGQPRWGIFKKLSVGWFGMKLAVTFVDGTEVIMGPCNPVMLVKRDGDWRKLWKSKLKNSAYKIMEISGFDEAKPIAELQSLIEDDFGAKNVKDDDED